MLGVRHRKELLKALDRVCRVRLDRPQRPLELEELVDSPQEVAKHDGRSVYLSHLELAHLDGDVAELLAERGAHDTHQVLTNKLERLLGVDALCQRGQAGRLHVHQAVHARQHLHPQHHKLLQDGHVHEVFQGGRHLAGTHLFHALAEDERRGVFVFRLAAGCLRVPLGTLALVLFVLEPRQLLFDRRTEQLWLHLQVVCQLLAISGLGRGRRQRLAEFLGLVGIAALRHAVAPRAAQCCAARARRCDRRPRRRQGVRPCRGVGGHTTAPA
mmetsp:Transcript_20306/g.60329  ORF Transcript_20306/g.60329 Transcript_20306/m.60329 type:complete len:271 (+) Transcript_20306:1702-2514(+)